MRFCPPFARCVRVALLSLVPTLLVSCAMPGGPTGGSGAPSRMPGEAYDGSRGQLLYTLTVGELRGKAWLQRDGRPIGLKVGSEVAENVPLQVGGRSTLQLRLGDHAQFELAPNSRLVVHQLPRQGLGDARATWLRLEQGYLRIRWKGALMEPPMQVSFGIWAARLKPGEYFFDTRGRVAAACAASGSMRLSGVPEWTPQDAMQQCLRLEANKAPLAIAMDDAQWNAVRAQRRLHPTLARAARDQSRAAIARLERDLVKSPDRRPAVAVEPSPPPAEPPPLAVAPRRSVPPTQRTPIPTTPAPRIAPSRADDASRERTEEELIREAEEEVRKAARAKPVPAPPPARAPDPVMPGPAASVALGPSPTIAPLPPMPAPRRAPAPVAPPPPPPPPPPPEPVYEAPPLAQHTPPVIVIPAEPEPEPAPVPPPPPPPPAPVDEPPIRVIEPPRAQHTPPVIVIPEQPEPPAPTPAPEPPPVVAVAPPPPPPPPPPVTPPSPPVITIPAEPAPQAIAPVPEPIPVEPDAPPPPIARSALSGSSIELAEQAPVVIPPPSQSAPPDSVRRPGSATPPSVPLDVAMYSVAAMPDRIGTSESALIVPPTITHEPTRSQWLVNIASYSTIEPAQEHARMLVSQKLRAGVREQALPDRMSYVVVIEGFPTEEAAETAAIDLEAHFDLDPY